MINTKDDIMGGHVVRIGKLKRLFEIVSVIWEDNIKNKRNGNYWDSVDIIVAFMF